MCSNAKKCILCCLSFISLSFLFFIRKRRHWKIQHKAQNFLDYSWKLFYVTNQLFSNSKKLVVAELDPEKKKSKNSSRKLSRIIKLSWRKKIKIKTITFIQRELYAELLVTFFLNCIEVFISSHIISVPNKTRVDSCINISFVSWELSAECYCMQPTEY